MSGKGKDTKSSGIPFRPSRLSLSSLNNNGDQSIPIQPDIIKCGYLRKLKTMKKKFFLLRMDSDSGPARLEYYDSEKKWRIGVACKRSIILKTCFNINKKMDSKQKFVIALYTKDDCFAIVMDNEAELDDWLKTLLALQQGHSGVEGDLKPKPNFEHVWQVNVKSKGLGSSRNITGPHRLCLTSKTLSLVKMTQDEPDLLDFSLMSIRRCGHSDCFFFMELGRSSVTGAGELWMQTEDTIIAQNMHEAILGAMKSSREHEDLGPLNRPRSASTSENSKPLATRPRPVGVVPPQPISYRDRCDSMPSRSRTVSEGHHHELSSSLATSVYSDSVGSNHSVDDLESDFHHRYHSHSSDVASVHTEPTITEESGVDDYLSMSPLLEGEQTDYIEMAPTDSRSSSSMFLNLSSADYFGGRRLENLSNPSSPTNGSDYVDMAATPSSTPTTVPDLAEGYIPMSPEGSLIVDLPSNMKKSEPSTLHQHQDGYVPMVPSSQSSSQGNQGYMEMTVTSALSSSLPKCTSPGYMHLTSPTHSSSHSLQDISCSPILSSAHKMEEEFHLDKVKSYFPPSEESDDYIKPVRAYSIGSRPQLRKNHLSTHLESFRVRAYSFGSQATGGSASSGGNYRHTGIESELGSMKKIDSSRASGKSSSAPLLPSGPQPPPPSRTTSVRNSGGGGRGDDLMEIVYASTTSSSGRSGREGATERVRTFSHGSSRQHIARHTAAEAKSSRGGGPVVSKSAKVPTDTTDSRSSYMTMGGEEKKKSEGYKMVDSNVTTTAKSSKNSTTNNSGDYVNLEMSSTTCTAAQNLTEVNPVSTKPNSSESHNYINLQLGNARKSTPPMSKKSTSVDLDYSDYTMMSPLAKEASSNSRRTSIKSPEKTTEQKSDVPLATKEPELSTEVTEETTDVCRDPFEDSDAAASQKLSLFIASGKRRSIVDGAYENILIAPGSASASRPSSVGSERELNYASLDLAPVSGDDSPRSPRTVKAQNPSPTERAEAPLSYAEIDFTKSEGLRHTSGNVREGRV